ncbi:MAG: hypothetical protein AAGF85_21420 [Bacteroidota bacterium]
MKKILNYFNWSTLYLVFLTLFVSCDDDQLDIDQEQFSSLEDVVRIEAIDVQSITFSYDTGDLNSYLNQNNISRLNKEETRSFLSSNIKELWLSKNSNSNSRVQNCDGDIICEARIQEGSTFYYKYAYGCDDELVQSSFRKQFNTSSVISAAALVDRSGILQCYDYSVATLNCSPDDDVALVNAYYSPLSGGNCYTDVDCDD